MKSEHLDLPASFLFKGQGQHLLLAILLVAGLFGLAQPYLSGGVWMGLQDHQWLRFMTIVVLVHQIIVALVFRLQLMYGIMTKLFGRRDMFVWGVIFLPLLMLRVVSLVGLGMSTRGTLALALPGVPASLGVAVGLVLLVPALYTLYSVFRYFGLTRALGADHFRQVYRLMPLEKRGMFRYSSNAMYTYAFFALWALALFTWSWPALIGALFQHAYIWVHWYCTEEPDMRVIYL
jgi:hypothetical protein